MLTMILLVIGLLTALFVYFVLVNYMLSAILLLRFSFNLISKHFVTLYQIWHASPALTSMELIIDLHHYVMFYLLKMLTRIKKIANYFIFSSKFNQKGMLVVSNIFISPQLFYISDNSFAMLEPELAIYLLVLVLVYGYLLIVLCLRETLESFVVRNIVTLYAWFSRCVMVFYVFVLLYLLSVFIVLTYMILIIFITLLKDIGFVLVILTGFSILFLISAAVECDNPVSPTGASDSSSSTGDDDPNRWWKRLLLLLGGVIILGGASWWVYTHSGLDLSNSATGALVKAPVEEVSEAVVQDATVVVTNGTLVVAAAVTDSVPAAVPACAAAARTFSSLDDNEIGIAHEMVLSRARGTAGAVAAVGAVARVGAAVMSSSIVENLVPSTSSSSITSTMPAVLPTNTYLPYDEAFFARSISEILNRPDLSMLDKELLNLALTTLGGDGRWSLTQFFGHSCDRVMNSYHSIVHGGHFIYRGKPFSASLLSFVEPDGRGAFMSPLIDSLFRRCPPQGLDILVELDEKLWEMREEALRRYNSKFGFYIHDLLLKTEFSLEEIKSIEMALKCLFSDQILMFLIFEQFEATLKC